MAHDKCICWKTTQNEKTLQICACGEARVEPCDKKQQVRCGEENNNKGREEGRWYSICLSSPRLCCLLMTPPNVHLRSSLFRWALCRLVTDRHTWWPDNNNKQTYKQGRHEEQAQMLDKYTAHKWHGSNQESFIISCTEDKRARPQSKTWWTVKLDGWRLQWKC